MSASFNLTVGGKAREFTLEETKNSTEKVVIIGGRGYKIIGKEEDVSILRSHIASLNRSEFTDLSSFKVSLESSGSKEKTDTVFHQTIASLHDKPMLITAETSSAEMSVKAVIGQRFDSTAIEEIVTQLSGSIKDYYPIREIANRCAAHLQKNNEAYKLLTDMETLIEKVNADLYEISHDKHLRMRFLTAEESKSEDDFTMSAKMIPANVGQAPDIGYIDLRGFGPVKVEEGQGIAEKEDAAKRIAEFENAIRILKDGNAKSVIIDLTKNNGGSPDSVELLCSYFMEEGAELSSIKSRNGEGSDTTIFKTLPYDVIPKKDRLLTIPVYILTSKDTFSGAEKFANDMQILKRGIIVGETTKGGANPGGTLIWGEYLDRMGKLRTLDVVVPTGETINLNGQPSWEGKGVIPNVPTDNAMKKVLQLINTPK